MRLGAEAVDLFDFAEFSSLSRALSSEKPLFGPRCRLDAGSGLISDMSKYLFDPLSEAAGWDALGRKFDVLIVGCLACVLVAGRATPGDIFRFGAVGLLTSGCGVFIPRLLDCRSRSWCHGCPAGSFCRRWKALLRGAGGEGARIFARLKQIWAFWRFRFDRADVRVSGAVERSCDFRSSMSRLFGSATACWKVILGAISLTFWLNETLFPCWDVPVVGCWEVMVRGVVPLPFGNG